MTQLSQRFQLHCLIVATAVLLAVDSFSGSSLHAQSATPATTPKRSTDAEPTRDPQPSDPEQPGDPTSNLDPDLLGDLQQFLDDALSKQPLKNGASTRSPANNDSKGSNDPSANNSGSPAADAADASAQDEMLETLRLLDQHLSAAATGLSRGDVGASTQAAQRDAVSLMQSILDQNGQNQNQDQQSSSQSQQSQQQADSQREKQGNEAGEQQQQQQGSETRDLGNEPGSDVGTGGEGIVKASELQAMREAVWGHLPERVRGQMRASRPEDYLPRYRDAIRDYFNQLSAPTEAKR